MLKVINIQVEGQALICDSIKAASDLIAEVRCDFTLSAEWAEFQTVAAIFEDKYGTKIEQTISNGYCMVPHEVLTNRGAVKVNLCGYKLTGETKTLQMTSYRTVIIEVLQAVNTSGDNSAAPTAPTWQQQLAIRLTDAPEDGAKYARKDGEWVTVTEGGGGGGGTSDYTQLTNKPQINGVTLTGNKSLANIGAAAANHTHSYNDLSDQPTIPEAYDDTALSGRVSTIEGKESGWDSKAAGNHTHAYSAITGKPSTFTPSAHQHLVADISDFPSIPTDNIELANGAGYITDAPSDSKQYARKNGAWAEVVAGGGGGGSDNVVEIVNWTSDGTVPSVKFDVDIRGYKAFLVTAYISSLVAADANSFLRVKIADVDAWYSGELLFTNKAAAGTFNLYSNGAIVLCRDNIAFTRLSWYGAQYNTTGFQPSTMSAFEIKANTRFYAEWYNRTVGNIPDGYKIAIYGIK